LPYATKQIIIRKHEDMQRGPYTWTLTRYALLRSAYLLSGTVCDGGGGGILSASTATQAVRTRQVMQTVMTSSETDDDTSSIGARPAADSATTAWGTLLWRSGGAATGNAAAQAKPTNQAH